MPGEYFFLTNRWVLRKHTLGGTRLFGHQWRPISENISFRLFGL
jgi:hypothetical protein